MKGLPNFFFLRMQVLYTFLTQRDFYPLFFFSLCWFFLNFFWGTTRIPDRLLFLRLLKHLRGVPFLFGSPPSHKWRSAKHFFFSKASACLPQTLSLPAACPCLVTHLCLPHFRTQRFRDASAPLLVQSHPRVTRSHSTSLYPFRLLVVPSLFPL